MDHFRMQAIRNLKATSTGYLRAVVVATVALSSVPLALQASAADSPKAKAPIIKAYVTQGADLRARMQAVKEGRPVKRGKLIDSSSTKNARRPDKEMPRQVVETEVRPLTPTQEKMGINAIADPLTDPITLQQCTTKAQAGGNGGWIKNHMAWCEYWGFNIDVFDPVTHLPIGGLEGEVAVILQGSSGAEAKTEGEFRFTRIQASGVVQERASSYQLELWKWTYNERGNPACGQEEIWGRGDDLETMISEGHWSVSTRPADGSVGLGVDKIRDCYIVPYFKFYEFGEEESAVSVAPWWVAEDDGAYNGQWMRCDEASYIKFGTGDRPKGCIFDQIAPFVVFHRSDTSKTEAVAHMDDALHHPERTLPDNPAKKIPGDRDTAGSAPLHRNYYDEALKSRSTTRMRQVCQAAWPGYPDQGKDCDEFPFNSTMEAAGNGQENFSARAINLSHNRSAGSALSLWYFYDRIIDQDYFYVGIRN